MKKLTAILLLGLLLFHWVGYQALYSYWMQRADATLETQLDKAEYNEGELETIVLPLHLPYLYDQATFERTDGAINLNGITYKYVQRRVWHDSLYLQCLPNHEAMRLNTARNTSFQATTDVQQPGNGFSKAGPAFSKPFTGGFETFSFLKIESVDDGNRLFVATVAVPFSSFTAAGPDQPPEAS